MKKSELRQLIREEIRKVVNESRVNESSNTDVESFLNEAKKYEYDFDFFKDLLNKTIKITWKTGNVEEYTVVHVYNNSSKNPGLNEVMLKNTSTKKAFSNRISTLFDKVEKIEVI